MATPVNPTNTPATVQPGASKSNLASLSPEQASRIQSKRDANYGVSTSSPQLLSNPRTQVTATGTQQISTPTAGGVQQKEATPTMVENPRITTSPEGVELQTPGQAYKAAEAATPPATPQVPQAPQTPAPTTATMPPARTGDVAMTAGGQMNEGVDGKGTERTTAGIGFDAATGLQGTPPPMPAKTAAEVAAEVDTFTGTVKEQTNAKSAWDRSGQLGNVAPLSTTEMSSGQKELDKIIKDPLKATDVPEGVAPPIANVNQLIAAIEAGQIESDAATDKVIANWEKRKTNMEIGAMEAEDRSIRDAANLMERIKHEREQAAEQINYELGRGTQDREKNIDQMEEDNSRLWGFMQRRLAKMGATNSSYAVAQLHKYTSLATAQLSDARTELSDYRGMMVSKEQDLAYKYGNQLMDIQNNLEDTLQQNRRQMYDQMLDIDQNVLQSEMEKTKNRQGLLIQMTQMKNEAQAQADSQALQVKNQALAEAQFAFTKLQTNKDNEYRNMSFTEQVRQFNKGFSLENDMYLADATGELYFGGQPAVDPSTGKTIRTMAGKQYDQQIDEWLTLVTASLHRGGMDTGEVTWARDSFMMEYNRAVTESDRGYNFDVAGARTNATGDFYDPVTGKMVGRSMAGAEFDAQAEQSRLKTAIDKVNAGISDPSILNQFKDQFDVIANGTYVGKQTLGDRIAGAMRTAAANIGNSDWQCAQFVRSIVPDLPTGLFSLADKVQKLVKAPGGFGPEGIPQPGDTIVLDWKSSGQNGLGASQYPGHVATVGAVKDGKALILQHNVPAGKTSSQWIDLNNGSIEGYWRSPKLSQQSAQQPSALDDTMAMVIGKLPESAREYTMDLYKKYISSGDTNKAEKLVQQSALQTLPGTEKTKYMNAARMADSVQSALSTINNIQADTGLYKTFFENTKKWGELQKDSEWLRQNAAVFNPVQQILTDLKGAAQSKQELEAAGLFLPTDDDQPQDVIIKLEEIAKYYRQQQYSAYQVATGDAPIPDGPDGKISVQLADGSTTRMDPYEYSQLLSGQ